MRCNCPVASIEKDAALGQMRDSRFAAHHPKSPVDGASLSCD